MQVDWTDVGRRLRQLREWSELTARELDRLAGVAQGYAALIENGVRRNIGAETMAKYASVFGVTLDWMVLGRGRAPLKETIVSSAYRARRQSSAA